MLFARSAIIALLGLCACSGQRFYEDDVDLQPTVSKKKTKDVILIVNQIQRHNEDGSYTYGYEGSDGSFKIETKSRTGQVSGKYGYVDDSGRTRTVEYGANQHGFQPSGEGITVPPPTLVELSTAAAEDAETDDDEDQRADDEERQRAAVVKGPAVPSAKRRPQPLFRPGDGEPVGRRDRPTPAKAVRLPPPPVSEPLQPEAVYDPLGSYRTVQQVGGWKQAGGSRGGDSYRSADDYPQETWGTESTATAAEPAQRARGSAKAPASLNGFYRGQATPKRPQRTDGVLGRLVEQYPLPESDGSSRSSTFSFGSYS